MLNSVTNIATSALQSASKQMQISAQNIASINQTSGTQENSAAQVSRRVENTSLVDGGVQSQVKQSNTPVSLEEEVVNQQFASYQFDASLKVLKAADATMGYLLDITA